MSLGIVDSCWAVCDERPGGGRRCQRRRTARIPIRLMRGYADELRVSRAVVKQGRRANTDSLQIWGELALEDLTENLQACDFLLTWGEQTFFLPAGVLRANRPRTLYTCGNVPTSEGARVWLKIDTQKCLFTAKITRTELEAVSGAVTFGMQFAELDESDTAVLP